MDLPDEFRSRMCALLDKESDLLFAALNGLPVSGLRINTLKTDSATFAEHISTQSFQPIPWCPDGFVIPADVFLGKHPLHAAGLYYLQDPSAMAVVEALTPQPGETVLDLAAAPGGKATHILSKLAHQGLLVANEIEASRTKTLSGNLERWGARQALIVNEKPERLADRWGAIFDKVLVDAPCSGEGMFRKTPATRGQWREEFVHGCAGRQRKLLSVASELVRPGGVLGYSTCTFAPEENEHIIAGFLADHTDFSIVPVRLPDTSPGRSEWSSSKKDLSGCVRIWPHLAKGEGHFLAILRREDGDCVSPRKPTLREVPKRLRQLWQTFVSDNLTTDPAVGNLLVEFGKQLYAVPANVPNFDKIKVSRAGLWLATIHRDRLEPSHSLAMTLHRNDVRRSFDMAADDERLLHYLQGRTLSETGESGWLLITVAGFPIAWGRRVQGVIKNAYPKGLRVPLG